MKRLSNDSSRSSQADLSRGLSDLPDARAIDAWKTEKRLSSSRRPQIRAYRWLVDSAVMFLPILGINRVVHWRALVGVLATELVFPRQSLAERVLTLDRVSPRGASDSFRSLSTRRCKLLTISERKSVLSRGCTDRVVLRGDALKGLNPPARIHHAFEWNRTRLPRDITRRIDNSINWSRGIVGKLNEKFLSAYAQICAKGTSLKSIKLETKSNCKPRKTQLL